MDTRYAHNLSLLKWDGCWKYYQFKIKILCLDKKPCKIKYPQLWMIAHIFNPFVVKVCIEVLFYIYQYIYGGYWLFIITSRWFRHWKFNINFLCIHSCHDETWPQTTQIAINNEDYYGEYLQNSLRDLFLALL